MLTQTDKALDLAQRLGGERVSEIAPSGLPTPDIVRKIGISFYPHHGATIAAKVRPVMGALAPGSP